MTKTFLQMSDFMYLAIDATSLPSRTSGGPSYGVENSFPMVYSFEKVNEAQNLEKTLGLLHCAEVTYFAKLCGAPESSIDVVIYSSHGQVYWLKCAVAVESVEDERPWPVESDWLA